MKVLVFVVNIFSTYGMFEGRQDDFQDAFVNYRVDGNKTTTRQDYFEDIFKCYKVLLCIQMKVLLNRKYCSDLEVKYWFVESTV